VDPQLTVEHIERLTQLIIDICGTSETNCGPMDDQQVNMPAPAPVSLRVARASKIIGMPLTQAQCADALQRLGLNVTQGDGVLTVVPPSYRFDLQIEEDLIEEVARMVGYDHLPHTPPLAPITAKIRPEALRGPFAVRRSLAALGYQETINFSFVEERWEHELAGNPNPIKLLNPIASQMSVMRSSLLGSLLQVLKFNQDRKATAGARV
jgi:phenylalanyl-tRNA synthetase beta chain